MDSTVVTQVVVATATLLASLGGYVLAGLNERKRDERILDNGLRVTVSERAARLDDQRHSFQLETLLALQDAVQTMARNSGRSLHFDHMQARERQYTQLPHTLNDDMHANAVEVRRLATRVLDPNVRDAVQTFSSICARLSISVKDLEGLSGEALEASAWQQMIELNNGCDAVFGVLGEVLRSELAWPETKSAG